MINGRFTRDGKLTLVKRFADSVMKEKGARDFLCLDSIEDIKHGRFKVLVMDEEINVLNKYKEMLQFLCKHGNVTSDLI